MKNPNRFRLPSGQLVWALGLVILAGLTSSTRATDRNYTNNASASYNTATFWNPNGVPTATDNALNDNGANLVLIGAADPLWTTLDIRAANFASTTGGYYQNGGGVNCTGWFRMGVSNASSGTYSISGGLLNVNATSAYMRIGEQGTGTLNITNGTVNHIGTTPNPVIVGNRDSATAFSSAASVGVINQLGGTFTNSGELWLGEGTTGAGATAGTFNLGGGIFAENSWLAIGRNGANGVLNITGGQLIKSSANNLTLAGIGTAQTGAININAGALTNLGGTWIGETANGVVNISGSGIMSVLSSSVGYNGGKGFLNISGGTYVSSQFNVAGNQSAASTSSQGHVIQTGGTISMTGGDNRFGGAFNATDVNEIGIYAMLGGTMNVNGNFQIGAYGNGLLSLGGGTWTHTAGYPDVGRFPGGFGVVDLNGGTINDNTAGTLFIVGEQGTGILNIRSGTLTDTSSSTTTAVSLGHTATGVGVLNLLGGTLNALSVGSPAVAGSSSTVNFNGGTLQARGANAAFLQNVTLANVFPGGAVIDSQGNAITIAQALKAPAGNGVTAIPVATGGAGYLTPPIVKITGGTGGTNATAIAITNGAGAVSSILITSPGVNYTAAPTVTLLGGGFASAATIGTVTIGANAATGGFTKNGSGTLTLLGANTFAGNVTLNNGLVNFTNASNLGTGTAITFNGGGLQYGNANNTDISTRTLTFNAGVATIDTGTNSVTFANAVGNSGSGAFAKSGSGILTLNTANAFSGNVTINAGALVIKDAGALGAGSKTVTDNNGTGGLCQLHLDGSGGAISLGSGISFLTSDSTAPGALVNDAGNNVINGPITMTVGGGDTRVTVTSGNLQLAGNITPNTGGRNLALDGAGNGVVSGQVLDGGFAPGVSKSGSGAWTLAAANTYTGNTIVNGGALILGAGGSIASSSAIVVSNAATLDVSAIAGFTLNAGQLLGGNGVVTGSVVAATGSKISPGASAGTLSLSNSLAMNGGVTNLFDLSNVTTEGSGVNDEIIVAGDLNLSGLNTIAVTITSGSLANGRYKLIKYAGALAGGAANFTVAFVTAPPRTTVTVDDSITNEIDLVVSATPVAITWLGDGAANNWDAQTTSNWLNGAARDLFYTADNVLFDDSSTNQNVNVVGGLLPGSTVVNAAKNYTLSGSGKVSGLNGLTKNNTGTLIVLTTNDYSGGTTIGGGTLQVGNGTASGDLGSGNVTNNGILAYNLPDTQTVAQVISGTGSLTKQGAGTLNLSGSNSYSGGSSLTAGTLAITNDAALGAGGGGLTFGGGTLQVANTNIANNRGVTLNAGGGTVNTLTGSSLTVSNLITGAGALTKSGPGVLIVSGNNDYSGGTTISAGTMQVGASPGGTLGSGPITNNALLQFSRTDDFTFTNDVSGTNGAFLKLAPSIMTLQATNTYLSTSPVPQVNGGTLQIDPAGKFVSGADVWIAQNAATGACIINGGTLIASNWLVAGRNSSAAVGALTLNSGSIQKFGGGNVIAGSLGANGTITINGGSLSNNSQILISEGATGVGTLVLNGGTAQATSVAKFGGLTATAKFNGGTLQAVGNAAPFVSGLDQALVQSGGAVIDDNGYAIGVNQALINDTGSPGGGLTKNGAGITTLSQSNSYTGGTTVNAGTLGLIQDAILHLSFDNANGAGNGSIVTNTGTGGPALNGTIIGSGANIVSGGRFGKALQIDGNGGTAATNIVKINSAVTSLDGVTGTWTVAGWVKTATAGGSAGGMWLFQGNSSFSAGNSMFYLINGTGGSGGKGGGVRHSGGFLVGTSTVLTNGNWHFIAITGNAGTKNIYVDGVLDTTTTGTWNTASTGDQVWIGGGNDPFGDGQTKLNGLIDEVYMFSRALNSSEILALFNFNNTGNPVLPSATAVTLASSVTLNAGGVSQTIASLSGPASSSVVLGDSSGGGAFTLNNAADLTYPGPITGTGGFTKIGSGTFTTTAANSYTLNTFVKSGTLVVDTGGVIANTAFSSIGQNTGDNGTLVVKGSGSYSTASDLNSADVGNSVGTINISDSATVAASALFVGSANAAGSTASGTVNQTNGAVTTASGGDPGFCIGGRNGSSALGIGVYNLYGGTLNVNNGGNVWLGGYGTGTMNVSGGSATFSGFVSIGRWAGGVGNMNISGGSVSQTNSSRFALLGESGTGTLTVSGTGQFNVNGGSQLLFGNTATGSGIVNLNGGTITVPKVAQGAGSGTFNFNGGTLAANGASATFMTGLTVANVQAGGAIINDGGFAISLGQVLWHDASLGATPDGGLTKNGIGTLSLSGVNTYTGDTHANAGTLALTGSGSIANSPNLVVAPSAVLDATGRTDGTLALAPGQTLKGFGTVAGTLAVSAGSTLAAGGSVGSITNQGATLLAGGGQDVIEVIDASGAPGSGYDTLVVNGDIGVLATSGSPFNMKLTSFDGAGAPGAVTNFDNNSSYIWTIASASGSVTNFDPTAFNVDTSNFANDLAGGYFYASSAGTVSLNFTNNHAPIAGTPSYVRPAGVGMKIAITNLLAGFTSDPDGDARALLTISTSSTNGLNNVSTNDTFIFYSPGTNGNVADAISYTIRDVRSTYRVGDTVRTASGTILISVSAAVNGQAQGITLSNSNAVVNFAGIPGYAYDAQRSTNLVDWVTVLHTNAPSFGQFQLVDDFSDLGAPPAQAYYRLSYTP